MATMHKTVQDPFGKLFGSLGRVRILRLFLFHPKKVYSLEAVAEHSRVSSAEARREIALLLSSGLVRKLKVRKKIRYGANERFAFFEPLRDMLLLTPLQGNDVYARVKRAGAIKLVVLAGVFAGNFEGGLDVLIVGDKLNARRLRGALKHLEANLGAEIQYVAMPSSDFLYRLGISDRFVRDVFDYPHRILFDKLDIGLK